ncbi:MAG: hypothetical protein WC365_04350 [Candidatus Babeliales bacterium]|jgi:hypothetical protein
MELQEFLRIFMSNAAINCLDYCTDLNSPCWVENKAGNYMEQDLTKCKLMKGIDFSSIVAKEQPLNTTVTTTITNKSNLKRK